MKNREFLNRYTNLPVLLNMLVNKQLFLLPPESWEDRNDSYCIEYYKKRMKMKTVLAVCFTSKRETFHHWKVFSSRSSGVCVEFDKKMLISTIDSDDHFRADKVRYKYIKEVEKNPPLVKELPFIKRKAFQDDGEFRILYENKNKEEKIMSIKLDLDSIIKINLSPWMPKPVAETVKKIIKTIDECKNLSIIPSSLIENTRWKSAIEKCKK